MKKERGLRPISILFASFILYCFPHLQRGEWEWRSFSNGLDEWVQRNQGLYRRASPSAARSWALPAQRWLCPWEWAGRLSAATRAVLMQPQGMDWLAGFPMVFAWFSVWSTAAAVFGSPPVVWEHVNVIIRRTRETACSHFSVPFRSPSQGPNLFIFVSVFISSKYHCALGWWMNCGDAVDAESMAAETAVRRGGLVEVKPSKPSAPLAPTLFQFF